jgi:hypothetical protein
MTFALFGCAQSSATIPTDGFLLVVRESPPPFCGRCDVYTISLAPDGRAWLERGWWAGDYADWRTAVTELRTSRARNANVLESLSIYRPAGERSIDDSSCLNYVTDSGAFTVEWRDGAKPDRLSLDRGCLGESALDTLLDETVGQFVDR